MTHNKYIGIIATAGIISWMAVYLVINKLNPIESLGLSMGLFFVSLVFALTSTFTILGYYVRVWFNKNEIYFDHINVALRQGILLTVVVIGALIFQLLGVLTWWSGLMLVAAIVLIELYFVARLK